MHTCVSLLIGCEADASGRQGGVDGVEVGLHRVSGINGGRGATDAENEGKDDDEEDDDENGSEDTEEDGDGADEGGGEEGDEDNEEEDYGS